MIIKGYGFIFIVVLCFDFYIVLCLVCFFCLLFGCSVLGMAWTR